MIIQNGHIRFLSATGGGLDAKTGHPVKAEETPCGKCIPCQWQAVSLDLQSKELGEAHVRATYTILVENYVDLPGERIVLYGRNGQEVGRFSVIRMEPLDAVCQVRITV